MAFSVIDKFGHLRDVALDDDPVEDPDDGLVLKDGVVRRGSAPGGGGGGEASGAYAEVVGDGTEVTFDIAHGLGTRQIGGLAAWDVTSSPEERLSPAWLIVDNNTVRVTFPSAPDTDGARVVVLTAGGETGGGGGDDATFVRASALHNSTSINSNTGNTKGTIFQPTRAVMLHGFGLLGDWASGSDYRLRLYELDGSRDVVATLMDETVSPDVSGVAELSVFVAPLTLTAGVEYAATVMTVGASATFGTAVVWPGSPAYVQQWPALRMLSFRYSHNDPTSFSSTTASSPSNDMAMVYYWSLGGA